MWLRYHSFYLWCVSLIRALLVPERRTERSDTSLTKMFAFNSRRDVLFLSPGDPGMQIREDKQGKHRRDQGRNGGSHPRGNANGRGKPNAGSGGKSADF